MKILDIDREIAEQQIPQSWQASYRKALSGNRPAAVKVMCGQCQGWEDGARQAIRDCPSVGCPLHAVRPFQKKAGSAGAVEIDSVDSEESGGNDLETTLARATRNVNEAVDLLALNLVEAKSRILDHLHRKGESQRGYILFSTGIPESLWNEAIRSLLAEGAIERHGEKRNTRYRLKGD